MYVIFLLKLFIRQGCLLPSSYVTIVNSFGEGKGPQYIMKFINSFAEQLSDDSMSANDLMILTRLNLGLAIAVTNAVEVFSDTFNRLFAEAFIQKFQIAISNLLSRGVATIREVPVDLIDAAILGVSRYAQLV